MKLLDLEPLNDSQARVFDSFEDGKNLVLSGSAGTGKTLISMFLGLEAVQERLFSRLVVVRSAVASRDIGFMPGNLAEKVSLYEAPYHAICSELYGRGDAYSVLKQEGIVEFLTTSYVRGITLRDSVVVLDEVQNLKTSEIDSIMTRVGESSRVVVIGDCRQTDLVRPEERRGIHDFISIAREMSCFDVVDFSHKDIVRSEFVREYLITRDRLKIDV